MCALKRDEFLDLTPGFVGDILYEHLQMLLQKESEKLITEDNDNSKIITDLENASNNNNNNTTSSSALYSNVSTSSFLPPPIYTTSTSNSYFPYSNTSEYQLPFYINNQPESNAQIGFVSQRAF